MTYAIVGFSKIGQALAYALARNINVIVASRRSPEELAPQARTIGPTVIAKSLEKRLKPTQSSWQSCSNSIAKLRKPCRAGKVRRSSKCRTCSAFLLKSWTVFRLRCEVIPGIRLVKGFNHLIAATLATDPVVDGGHRVVFLSSDDEDALSPGSRSSFRISSKSSSREPTTVVWLASSDGKNGGFR